MQILRLNDNRVPENPTPCFFTHIMCGTSVHDAAHDTSVISKQNLLLEFCADPKSRDEMQAYIDVSRQTQKQKPEIHYRSFQIIFASFTHTSNPELHILNPVPYPTASGSPIGLIKNAINNKINPFCGEYVINTATPNKARIMLISPRTRPDT